MRACSMVSHDAVDSDARRPSYDAVSPRLDIGAFHLAQTGESLLFELRHLMFPGVAGAMLTAHICWLDQPLLSIV